ncbi:universal stress protein [Streptomyces sp. NPDC005574]|uniref:universal stress protein n=1 Tax=Streptomyces sp. NPDC005574 TaxID=3156891 RepID=UPI0033A141B9
MTLPLVVGVDGSEASLLAVDWAVDEAARHGLSLRLVYASLWERYEGATASTGPDRPFERALQENIVASAADRSERRDPDVKVSTDIIPEDAADALLHEGHHAHALVTGSRGRGGAKGLLLGSVGLTVAARAYCPVIVIRGDRAGVAGSHGRILLGAGEPVSSAAAVRFALREAEARGCVLDVVRAWRSPTLDGLHSPGHADLPVRRYEERASTVLDVLLRDAMDDHPDVRVRQVTVEGPAHNRLVQRSAAADLVIVGARRRHGQLGLQLGRVSHTLLHHAACPVAVVPQLV